MTQVERLPLRDTAIYNPHLLSKDELLGIFSAREKVMEQLLEDLRRCKSGEVPQHHLLVAQRGMGKTTLLLRFSFAVEDDRDLSKLWLPLVLPEEQYNVGKLSDFWLNCIDALSDMLERSGRGGEAEKLEEKRESLLELAESSRSREALALLLDAAQRLERRLVLLIDNIDLVLERAAEQAWELREVLSEESRLLLIGASARALEMSYKYGEPFYDFFHIHELRGLDLEETKSLLTRYAEQMNNQEVLQIVQEEPTRVRTLHALTGGNPRTLALLYNILGRGLEGDVRADLESLLDLYTPLYKARLEVLSAQQQQVVHALAVHWHPMSAGDVANTLQLAVNAVSSQLNRLVKEGLVEAVPFDPPTKTGFQIAERFFSIWYLMRTAQRARRRLVWFIDFLRMFYSQEELVKHAFKNLRKQEGQCGPDRLRIAEYSLAIAEALEQKALRKILLTSSVYYLIEDKALYCRLNDLVDLDEEEIELRLRVEHKERLKKMQDRVCSAKPAIAGWSADAFWNLLAHSVRDLSWKEKLAEALSAMSPMEFGELVRDLEKEEPFLVSLTASETLIRAVRTAFAKGWMMTLHDIEGALFSKIQLKVRELSDFAFAMALDHSESPKMAIQTFGSLADSKLSLARVIWAKNIAAVDPQSVRAAEICRDHHQEDIRSFFVLANLAIAWLRLGHANEASESLDRAIALGMDDVPQPWLLLTARLCQDLGDELSSRGHVRQSSVALDWAAALCRAAAKRLPESTPSCIQLGVELVRQGIFGEAERAFRRATELSPDEPIAWQVLGAVLYLQGKSVEAEVSCRKRLEIASESALAWCQLAHVLVFQDRLAEAEQAFRKAFDLEPESAEVRRSLAQILHVRGSSSAEAEELARQAARAEPKNPKYIDLLACILARNGKWSEAFEKARTLLVANIEDLHAWPWHDMREFFHSVISASKAREAADLLDELGVAERWQPLRAALEVAALDRRDYLKRLAPEIRQPAEEILKQIGWEEKPLLKPKRKSKRR